MSKELHTKNLYVSQGGLIHRKKNGEIQEWNPREKFTKEEEIELKETSAEIDKVKKSIKKPSKYNGKKEQEEDFNLITSFYKTTNNILLEQCYDGKNSYFAVYNPITDIVSYENEYDDNGIIIKPIESEEVIKEYIRLPSKAEDYNSEKELDKQINDFITKWLDVNEIYKKFAIYNIRKSWVYDIFHSLNYLRALGDYGTGKSRFLDTFGYLHYKPIATSGALTSAVLFRIINKWKGTLIIDEADFKNGDESAEVIKIINQGYERGRPVMRVDKDNHGVIQFFEVYCPKVIATRREFPDKATESRCMTNTMLETHRKDIPPNLTKEFWEEAQNIRNKLLMWRFKNYNKIDVDAGANIDLGDIEPRLRQINTGFIALLKNDQEAIEEFKIFLKDYSQEQIEARSETIEGRIVNLS
jgi:hypothetical protein